MPLAFIPKSMYGAKVQESLYLRHIWCWMIGITSLEEILEMTLAVEAMAIRNLLPNSFHFIVLTADIETSMT